MQINRCEQGDSAARSQAGAPASQAAWSTAEPSPAPSSTQQAHLSASTAEMWEVPWSSGCTPALEMVYRPPYAAMGSVLASRMAELQAGQAGALAAAVDNLRR